ncbi:MULTISPECIES: type VI secretion system protein TssA [unclassified Sphingomonas]|uniref:type VI secretion system protein TssA n=2 Tax=Sphingomonas TaxID=13687 RepID=UPI00082C1D93|nr:MULTISPECIES: type VI secretion system ImpA family N-terminal domain-containing protein [unclassified Sphingomonas]
MVIDEESRAALLAPIGDGVGIDGREDEGAAGELFREIRFQRKTIFRQEQRAAMGEDADGGDAWSWDMLAESARDYLTEHSKDLETMAVLVEASTRVDGLLGLSAGMAVMADLIEQYWDNGLYPVEDEEDGVEARFQPLSGLSGGSGDKDGTLVQPLRRLVLAVDAGDQLRFLDKVSADALLAASQNGTPEQKAQRQQEAQAAYDAIEALARRIPRRVLQRSADEVAAAEAAWRRGVAYVSERTKPRFPAASRVSDELRGMADWLQSLIAKLPDDPVDAPADDASAAGEGGAAATTATAGGPMVIGRISQRDDALRAIAAAADYFERYEPLSPLGPSLREVDRRARLSLDALLTELIPDASVRETFYWRSGIKPPAGEG